MLELLRYLVGEIATLSFDLKTFFAPTIFWSRVSQPFYSPGKKIGGIPIRKKKIKIRKIELLQTV